METNKFKIIDFHTHAFPDGLAEKALAALSENTGGELPMTDGTVTGLLKSMDEAGIEKSVVASIATKETQVYQILEWSMKIRTERIYPLLSVHPDFPEPGIFLQEAVRKGFGGIKLHPMYQDFAIDDKKMFDIYAACRELDMFILFHSGYDLAYPSDKRADVERYSALFSNFPGLKMVASHLGGWKQWERVRDSLAGKEIYLDSSMTLGYAGAEALLKILNRHSPDRIVFGTDSPWAGQKIEVENILSLPVPDNLKEKILFNNAEALLGGTAR